ncbi:unnamed protein product [Rhizophagus irregularis]|nr:unnamed protein product [Rhizophagus irregularis]
MYPIELILTSVDGWFIAKKSLDFNDDISEVHLPDEQENDTNVLHQLHIGEIVTIVTEDDETFAIIRSIFSHQYNNQQFAFVSVDGFEITNRTVLECPVFKLRSTNRQ